ncbi:MAG: hypothetical protein DME26_21485 [Verrucomicrobia bacterium]|nr:MAG: hypothetical protein DME26_21485 [Verrucomicrobiota bacterium]
MGTNRPKLFRLNARSLGPGNLNRTHGQPPGMLIRANREHEPAGDRPGRSGNDAKSTLDFAESTCKRPAAGGTPARQPRGRLVRVGVRFFFFFSSLGIWGVQSGLAQTLTIRPIKDFKVPDYYPNATRGGTNQLRTLLTGVEARPRPDGRVFVTKPHILSFSDAGQTQAVVQAVDCVFDYKSNAASSTNTLQFQTGDGRFLLEGLGFHWNRTNSNLVISNKARTTISRPLMESTSPKLNPAKSTEASPQQGTVEILSDGFEFISSARVAIWRRDVRVKEPKSIITCELLTGEMADDGGGMKLQSVFAETNVVIMISESNNVTIAKGDKAVYSAQGETLLLSGKDPQLESESSHLQISSPYLTIDLKAKALKAGAPARTKIPAGALAKVSEGGLNPLASGPHFRLQSGNLAWQRACEGSEGEPGLRTPDGEIGG